MGKLVSFTEFEQYVDIEDRLWNMGKEFFTEVQTFYPQLLVASPHLCHYDDVYVDGTDTLEIGYEVSIKNDYELFMIEIAVTDFLDDHIGAAKLCADSIQDVDAYEQIQHAHQEIDSEFANFEG